MIRFGSTYTCMPDSTGISSRAMESAIASCDRVYWLGLQNQTVVRGDKLNFLTYAPLQPPTINQLVIPTGASRWSYCVLLVTNEQKAAILTEYNAAPQAGLLLEYSHADPEANPLEGDTPHVVKIQMWPLSPHAVSTREVNENAAAASEPGGLWLLPIVDHRYFWNRLTVGSLSTFDATDAADLLNHIAGLTGRTFTTDAVHADYDLIPDVSTFDNELLSHVLDSVATQLGMVVAPDMSDDSAGLKYALLDTAVSVTIHDANLGGTGGLDQSEVWPTPTAGGGDAREDQGGVQYADGVDVLNPDDTFTTVSATDVGFNSGITGTVTSLRFGWVTEDNTLSATLSERIAIDFFGRFDRQHDYRFDGIARWQPTAFTDVLIYTQCPVARRCDTRVRSIPPDWAPVRQDAGTGTASSGTSVTADCSCDCVTNTDIVVNGYDTTARMYVTFRNNVSAIESTKRIVFAAGTYPVDNTGSVGSPTTTWERAVTSADVTVYDNLGADVTGDHTVSGYIRFEPFSSPDSVVTLHVDVQEVVPGP